MKSICIKSIVLLLAILSCNFVFSQEPVLEITHKTKKKKTKYLKKERKVKLKYENKKYKGRIDSFTTNSFFIDGKEFKINKVEKIRIKYKGTMIAGGAVTGTGLLVSGLGLTMFFSESKNPDSCSRGIEDVILKIFGIAITAVGTMVTVGGSVLFFVGKSFNFNKKYNLKIIELIE